MNNYRRFKFPFGGETPEEFAAARRAYYENVDNSAMQAINATPVVNANTVTQPIDETSPREYLRQYTERVRPEVERRVNEMNRRPSGNGRIIRNHDKLYDYYKDGDKLYYRKKGGKNWIDISDNELAQKRINATIARNKRTYSSNKNAAKKEEAPVTTTTTKATSVANTTPTKAKNNSTKGSYPYSMDNITNIVRNAIYGNRSQFTPSKAKSAPVNSKPAQPQGRRLNEPKTRPYTYHGGKKYNVFTDGKGNWIE